MKAEIINTGTELLLGEVVNSHAAYLGGRLRPLGVEVGRQLAVPDGPVIREVVADSFGRCEILILTGGLGPTPDDLTRETVAELLGRELEVDEGVLAAIEARLTRRGFPMSENNRRQAMVPAGGEVLPNPNGTAPGLYVPAQEDGSSPHIFMLPGPPRELYPMMEGEVEPRLRALLPEVPSKTTRNFKIYGLGESRIARAVGRRIPEDDELDVGYRLGAVEINVRLVGEEGGARLEEGTEMMRRLFRRFLVSEDDTPIEGEVVRALAEVGQTVATAESCTGGLLASRITDVSGSSAVFESGAVTYSNAAKSRMIGVDPALIEENGAVSRPVAAAMAEGALSTSGADHALSLTGVAGPTGGSEEKPVGTVFIGLATRGGETFADRFFFPAERSRFKLLASNQALDLLRRRLAGLPMPRAHRFLG